MCQEKTPEFTTDNVKSIKISGQGILYMHFDYVYVFVYQKHCKLGGLGSHAHLNDALIALTEMLAGQADYCCCCCDVKKTFKRIMGK